MERNVCSSILSSLRIEFILNQFYYYPSNKLCAVCSSIAKLSSLKWARHAKNIWKAKL